MHSSNYISDYRNRQSLRAVFEDIISIVEFDAYVRLGMLFLIKMELKLGL